MAKNKVKYGLKNVVYAPFTIDENGAYVYGTVKPIPGAVNLSLSAEGDSNDFFADNIKYFSSTANQGYSGDLEIAIIPEDFRTDILGETKDANGVLIEDAAVLAKGFAFGFQVEGDAANRRVWYFNCNASRANDNAQTTEASITPTTDTLTIKAMPRLSDSKVRAMITKTDSNTAVYNSFFDSVYGIETSE